MSTNHPLVGKKLVAANPQQGEVTASQITNTLEGAYIEDQATWLVNLDMPTSPRWIVSVDRTRTIVAVTRT